VFFENRTFIIFVFFNEKERMHVWAIMVSVICLIDLYWHEMGKGHLFMAFYMTFFMLFLCVRGGSKIKMTSGAWSTEQVSSLCNYHYYYYLPLLARRKIPSPIVHDSRESSVVVLIVISPLVFFVFYYIVPF